jgi:CheY-like chemotaxis protein
MPQFKELLAAQGFQNRFNQFQNLMRFRVENVLLVASVYESFILEENGQFYERVTSDFNDLNLSEAPLITRVSNGNEALRIIRTERPPDLIITSLNLGDMDAFQFAKEVNGIYLDIPMVPLLFDASELKTFTDRAHEFDFEKPFIWQGSFRVLLAIISYIEDKTNVAEDTRTIGVQSILVIEDNVIYYSSLLPSIFVEVFNHSHSLASEGINSAHKLLRNRARPKVLFCTTAEEAGAYLDKYAPQLMGVISDIEFPRHGLVNKRAGIEIVQEIKRRGLDIPIMLQSDRSEMEKEAESLGASFMLKSSPTLFHDLQTFMKKSFSFGDFIFRLPSGEEIGRARNMQSFEQEILKIPEESLIYHANHNHFSKWLIARTEFLLAHTLRPRKLDDYQSVDAMRQDIIAVIRGYRQARTRSTIADFNARHFDSGSSFARVGSGSMGGKARGLAFINHLLNHFKIRNCFAEFEIAIPVTLVVGTGVFDQFIDMNQLRDFAIDPNPDSEIVQRFLEARFPENIQTDLAAFLDLVESPLAVRSSSLLEDSKLHPFAGIYHTFMLSNNHPDKRVRFEQLIEAVKRVYASTFLANAKAYMNATSYRLEEEKMAVVIQKIVGTRHESRYYPDFSGVARSHNFYPRPPMEAMDGIVAVGLGMGEQVVTGGTAIRFCPKFPQHGLQYSNVKEVLDTSQKEFYAIDLANELPDDGKAATAECNEDFGKLGRYTLADAEQDRTLNYLASTYSHEDDSISDGISRTGARLITFAPLLKDQEFRLSEVIELTLEMGKWGMSSPVEVEFAVNLSRDPSLPKEFNILQIRPLVQSREIEELNIENGKRDDMLCKSAQVLGNGLKSSIFDVLFVHPERFNRAHTKEAAQELAVFNYSLAAQKRSFIVFGMGRWGSADPWLGIPILWQNISGAAVMVEGAFSDMEVEPSQGTHFFQNLTSFQVGYFSVTKRDVQAFIDWDWLVSQPPMEEKKFVTHLQFREPLLVKINGHIGAGVIYKPGRVWRGA